MSFKVIDKKTIKKSMYTKLWKRVSSLMDIEFNSEPIYSDNDKYIKTKINSYGDKVNTNFQDNKIRKECILQVFIIDNARFSYKSK